jgi:hypothetical protein
VTFSIHDTDPRLVIDTPTLAGLLDAVLALDSRLGNIAPSADHLKQIVDCTGRRAWYVIEALHRASRPGVGRRGKPEDSPIFLDNVRTAGKQCWATFALGDARLVGLANPSPHVDGTLTITSMQADPQTWRAEAASATVARIKRILGLMVALAGRLPGRYVSFNNDGSGNSLSQFHVTVNRCPQGIDEWPVDRAIARHAHRGRNGRLILGPEGEYPVPTIVISGPDEAVVERMSQVIAEWDTQPDRTGNVIARRRPAEQAVTAVFWPRSRAWRYAPGFRSGEIAFMELSGCFVASNQDDVASIDCGKYDYRHFWRVLRAVADHRAFEFAEYSNSKQSL